MADLPEDKDLVDAVLKGRISMEKLPQAESRVIRLFISSTFTDTVEERNYLLRHTFPKVKAYCRARYGIEFHAVDMRWGIPIETRDEHMAAELCIHEVRHSQKCALGPHFLAFLGEKYGTVNLPSELSPGEFEPIRFELLKKYSIDRVSKLEEWYKKDLNSNTPDGVYVLQPISAVLGEDQSGWEATERELFAMVVEGAQLAAAEGTLSQEALRNIACSITEKEIQTGALDLPGHLSTSRSVLCVVRTITDLEKHVTHPAAYRFMDLIAGTCKRNKVKQEDVRVLREEMLIPKLDKKNVLCYSGSWVDPDSKDKESEAGSYVNAFTNTANSLCYRLQELVDRNVKKQKSLNTDFLYRDVIQHWHIAKQKCANFTARKLEQLAISKYLTDTQDSGPLIIHGQPGTGKSSLLSKAASDVEKSYIQAGQNADFPSVLLRHCGMTPTSSNIRQLLQSLCHQMAFVSFMDHHKVPVDFNETKLYFRNLLQHGYSTGKLVLFIDALNDLSSEDGAYTLDWLPNRLAPNVKLVLSTTSQSKTMQQLLSKYVRDECYVELNELEPNKCTEILKTMLKKRKRDLTMDQWILVEEAFKTCSLPLFTQLTFEAVLLWRSYMKYDAQTLGRSVEKCINVLFSRLEKKHGFPLVSKAIAYITASRDGISETELEDVASIDDHLLNAIFQLWEPPIRRLPSMLLERLKSDMEVYLNDRQADDITVICWCHQQFTEVAKTRYLSDGAFCREVHGNMADYYNGVWSNKPKPFEYSEAGKKRFKPRNTHSVALRYVPEQPLVFETFPKASNTRYNVRKLNQMPYHLASAGRHDSLMSQVFFNFNWIHTKLKATSVQKVISDYSLINDQTDVALVADALRMSEVALAEDPDVLGIEFTGRLLNHFSIHWNIRHLITQCDKAALQKCPIVPNWQVYQAPGGPLQYVCEVDTNIRSTDVDLIQNNDTVLLMVKPYHDNRMRVWDIALGVRRDDMNLPTGSNVFSTPDGKFIHLIKNKRFLQIFRLDSGEMHGEIDFGHGNIDSVEVSNRYTAITKEYANGPVLIDNREKKVLSTCHYVSSKVAISKDDLYMLTHNESSLLFHSMPSVTLLAAVRTKHKPTKMLFTSNNLRFYVLDKGNELKSYVVSLSTGKAVITTVAKDNEIKDFVLSNNEELLLAQAQRCLHLFNTKNDRLLHSIARMPPSLFTEHLTTFKSARFNSKDTLVIAIRHTYLASWCARKGTPLHIIQTSVAPVMALYTCSRIELAITLLEDYSIKVWNLENLSKESQHLNSVLRSSVKCMSVAINSDKIICCGKRYAEAMVVDISTMKKLCTLTHSEDTSETLCDVMMSPNGSCALTRTTSRHYPYCLKPWRVLRDDKLWDVLNGQLRFELTNNRYVLFTPDSEFLVCVHCIFYSTYDWTQIHYDLFIFGLKENLTKDKVALPKADVIGEPVVTVSSKYMCFLLQLPKLSDTFNDGKILPKPGNISYKISLYIYIFQQPKKGVQPLDVNLSYEVCEENVTSILIDIQTLTENKLLLMTGSVGKGHFTHNTDGTLFRGDVTPKSCLLYSLDSQTVLHRYGTEAHHLAVMPSITSQRHSRMMDYEGRIYDTGDGQSVVNTIDISNVAKNGVVLILEGKYAAILLANCTEIVVVCTTNGEPRGHLYVHGLALHIATAVNDRTLVIVCKDGRILVFTVVLDLENPLDEFIRFLPSRQWNKTSPLSPVASFTAKAKSIGRFSRNFLSSQSFTPRELSDQRSQFHLTSVSNQKFEEIMPLEVIGASLQVKAVRPPSNEKKREDNIIRSKIEEQKRKFPSIKSVGRVANLTQRGRNMSQACIIS